MTAVTVGRLSGRTVLYSGEYGTVGVWDVETLQLLDTIHVPGEARELKADPAGYLVVDTGTEVIRFAHSSATA